MINKQFGAVFSIVLLATTTLFASDAGLKHDFFQQNPPEIPTKKHTIGHKESYAFLLLSTRKQELARPSKVPVQEQPDRDFEQPDTPSACSEDEGLMADCLRAQGLSPCEPCEHVDPVVGQADGLEDQWQKAQRNDGDSAFDMKSVVLNGQSPVRGDSAVK